MQRIKWNDNWMFWKENDAFELVWTVSGDAKRVTLPHDAMLEEYAYAESRNGSNTGYRDGGVYYYSKTCTPQESDSEKTLMLLFEGVYMNAMVYVNTELAAKCPYGYTGFYVKLNDYLRYGQENEIRVIVRNSGMSNSRWYSGGGIYRDVYLLAADRTYIRPDGCLIDTERVDELAVLAVRTELVNRGFGYRSLTLETIVKDAEGEAVASERTPLTLFEGESRTMRCRVAVEEPKLWSERTPYLYTVELYLYEKETLLDRHTETFGIRSLSLDAKRGLRVNNETVKLRGACIHHDNGIIGAVSLYDAEYRRIAKLKEEGFNAIRMSHHPAGPQLLRACDELGMYVMDECFDMWNRCKKENDYALFFDKWWEQDVEAMVRKDYNHPSVILYSVGNEIPEIGTNHGAKVCHDITEKIKSLDHARYTLASINGIFSVGEVLPQIAAEITEKGAGDGGNVNDFMASMFGFMDKLLLHREVSGRIDAACAGTDIAGYNYMTERYDYDSEHYPNRVIVGSETYPRQIAENWKHVKEKPNLIGDFTWTGWDYIGEAGIGVAEYGGSGDGMGTPYPCQFSYTGDIDITGFRKPASYYKEIVFGLREAPYICCQRPQYYGHRPNMTPWCMTDAIESWSFAGYEGKPIQVEVFSAGDEVELFVNGNSVGRKPAGEAVEYRVFFDTVYEAGKIQAVTYRNGQEIGMAELVTAAAGADLAVSVTQGREEELYYIDIDHVDAQGRTVTEDDVEVTVRIEGSDSCDTVLRVGSGSHSPLLDYKDGRTLTWNGHAQAIVRKVNKSVHNIAIIESRYGVKSVEI